MHLITTEKTYHLADTLTLTATLTAILTALRLLPLECEACALLALCVCVCVCSDVIGVCAIRPACSLTFDPKAVICMTSWRGVQNKADRPAGSHMPANLVHGVVFYGDKDDFKPGLGCLYFCSGGRL